MNIAFAFVQLRVMKNVEYPERTLNKRSSHRILLIRRLPICGDVVVEFVVNDVEIIDRDVVVTLVGGSVAIERRKSTLSKNESLF